MPSTADNLALAGMATQAAAIIGAAKDAPTTLTAQAIPGVSGPLAIELARQVTAASYRSDYLVALGLPTGQARVLAGS